MGQQPLCGSAKQILQDPLAFKFDQDSKQNGINHTEQLQCTNKEVQKILDSYVDKLKDQKTLYKDPSMSSDPIILKSNSNQFNCTYQRPYKFLTGCQRGKSYRLIDSYDSKASSIQVKDEVMQYFGVFLCFLADKPIEIQKIICTKQNSYGFHCIQIYQDGRVVKFLIDDYILCKQPSPKLQPMFSQPQKNIYMWPCILEKAWFKIKGNSAKRVEQNTPSQVFETFLPFPIQKIILKQSLSSSPRQIITKAFSNFGIGNTKDRGYICRSKKNPEHNIGLSGGQYFYLLDTFVDEGKRMFYLRNPCVDMGFRGLHDQISPKLKDILYKRNFVSNIAGNFLIDQQQFIQQMAQIQIIHYVSGSKITTYSFKCQNQQQFFLGFDLKYKGTFNLSIIQVNNGISKNKEYCPLTYQVVRLSDMKLIGGFQNKQGCFGVKNTYLLDRFNQQSISSKYLIRLKKKQYHQIPNLKVFLIGYYMQTIKFELPTQFQLEQKWKQFLRAEGARQLAIDNNHHTKTPDISHVVCWIGDVAFIYVQKRSKKQQISIQVNFPQLMNLQCISHPEIRRSDQWKTYKFTDKFLIIFEKISLTAETQIRQYHIQAY